MAALPQPQSETAGKDPARELWGRWMQAAPFLASILRGVGVGVEFFIGGHFIVALGHRVIKTSGRIAETALLLATLWITAANVTPNLVGRLGPGVVSTLNDLSLMAFSLLPEVIVFSAILATYQHWVRFFLDRRRSNPAWIWASLYSLPTASFLIMTILTISSFVSEHGASASQATGLALVIRCLSGWFYGLIELISASIGKPHFQTYTVHQIENSMAELVATTRATLEQQAASIATNTEQRVASQVASIERKIENKVASQIATIESLIETTVASIEPLIESKVASQGASIETLIETRIAPLIANGMMVASTSDGGRSQGITADQFEMLVQLIHRQARTIEQLSSSLSEVKRTVVTEIREIRETRSFPQETPTLSGPQAQTRALPLPEETTVEVSETGSEDGEKPGTRVLRFLQECQARNHKPTLLEIQQACQVAKKTATTYRKSFYGDESSQADEGD